MRLSISKDVLKKIIFIGVNYQLIINILPILFIVIGTNILDEPFNMDIQKYTLIAILWTITIPPIWEELFFRKFLYTKLKNKFNMKRAIFISSLLFGLMHFNIIIMIFAYGVGVISCKIYDKTGEIKYSILFHAISNLFNMIFHNYISFNVYSGSFSLSAIQIILTIILIISIVLYTKYSSKLLESI